MNRAYNFSAGPATLPTVVLQQAQKDLLNWQNQGASVMELSHRNKAFIKVAERAEENLRKLLNIPANFKILFLQGGARNQFSMVPLNILGDKTIADYIDTGTWSNSAIKEARRYCQVNIVASAEQQNYTTIPDAHDWQLSPNAAYVHYCDNETIHGVEFADLPEVGSVPLVSDMSSNILSKPLDMQRFAVIYAGAQKNMGPAGVTLVIVRDDLLGFAHELTPSVFNYKLQAEKESMYNTPPTFAWYMVGLVAEWLLNQGGVAAQAEINQRKAAKLYQAIDDSSFYYNSVIPEYRSRMNVPFVLAKPELDNAFLAEAEKVGLVALKGHRSVGGMRASIYNAMPESGVDTLISFMHDFEKRH